MYTVYIENSTLTTISMYKLKTVPVLKINNTEITMKGLYQSFQERIF